MDLNCVCKVTTTRINTIGKDIITFYGPSLELRATVFIDDITRTGNTRTANNSIYDCKLLEEKKMTFNNSNGKTEYVVIKGTKKKLSRDGMITEGVKRGEIERNTKHKTLGMWIDEKGTFGINIIKRKEKLSHMIETIKAIASTKNMGILAMEARFKLSESIILPSILYNVEVIHNLQKKEIDELEKMQAQVLKRILEVPDSTPYYGILMETGWWTMKARIEYKKMMLYHNIENSHEERIIKKILNIQKEERREGTWYSEVKKSINMYKIQIDVKAVNKSVWKKTIKNKSQTT